MSVLVECSCGKRYRIAENSRAKQRRCKECGEELSVPSSSQDEDWGSIDQSDDWDDDEPTSPSRTRRRKKKVARRKSKTATSMLNTDLLVRGIGATVFLVTLGNAGVQFLIDEKKGRFVALGIGPILVFGLIGLYIAYVGEEPDPEECRRNRYGGIVSGVVGIVMFIIGVTLTAFVSSGMGGGYIIFYGLMGSGVLAFIFGGLSALTGRNFRSERNSE